MAIKAYPEESVALCLSYTASMISVKMLRVMRCRRDIDPGKAEDKTRDILYKDEVM